MNNLQTRKLYFDTFYFHFSHIFRIFKNKHSCTSFHEKKKKKIEEIEETEKIKNSIKIVSIFQLNCSFFETMFIDHREL